MDAATRVAGRLLLWARLSRVVLGEMTRRALSCRRPRPLPNRGRVWYWPIVSDAVEAVWQDVDEEAADELVCCERHPLAHVRTVAIGEQAYMVTAPGNNCTSQTFKNNDCYPLAGNVAFSGYNQGGMSSVAAWNAASADTGVSTNPNFGNGGGGASTTCYTAGSGVPVQPGTIPCPTNYELQPGSALIAAQDGLNNEIAPSLTAEELQTVREALWKREADLVRHYPDHLTEPTVFQQMAFNHLLNGGALRAGDFTALHGALLSALQPNTDALAKRWQHLMDCYLNSAECPTN